MVAREFRTGRTMRVWEGRLAAMPRPPFAIEADSLFVAYYASAELSCFLALGWPMPARILDLFCEFRNLTNGRETVAGNGLLGALAYFGLGSIDAAEKTELRALAQRPGEHTEAEQAALLDYCESDVVALAKLLPAMLPSVDLPRALLRGRFMAAAARMETNGTPIDTESLERLRANWRSIQGQLVERIDADYGVYVPTGRTIDPDSTYGAEFVGRGRRVGNRPLALDEAARGLWQVQRDAVADRRPAIAAARRQSGLSVRQIERWENAGRDYSTWPGLDTDARTLAAGHPELGIGRGYESETNYDPTDYAGRLWENCGPISRRHRGTTRNLETSCGIGCRRRTDARYCWPFIFGKTVCPIPSPRGYPVAAAAVRNAGLDDDTFRQMARHLSGSRRVAGNCAIRWAKCGCS